MTLLTHDTFPVTELCNITQNCTYFLSPCQLVHPLHDHLRVFLPRLIVLIDLMMMISFVLILRMLTPAVME